MHEFLCVFIEYDDVLGDDVVNNVINDLKYMPHTGAAYSISYFTSISLLFYVTMKQ